MNDKKEAIPTKKLRLKEYTENLLEKRRSEPIKEDVINEFNIRNGQGITSPTTGTTTEETRLLMDYIARANMFHISKSDDTRGKLLKLRKFFKTKRNQQVEIYFKCGVTSIYKEGKVSTIGRDFVMVTNLRERIWIPYSVIESANIPFGIPNYSNTHQNYLFDNHFRKKLVYQFGETVAKRDILKQQFFEESLRTNLHSWQDTWVAVYIDDKRNRVGKIQSVTKNELILSSLGEKIRITLGDIQYVETIRFFSLFKYVFRTFSSSKKQIT